MRPFGRWVTNVTTMSRSIAIDPGNTGEDASGSRPSVVNRITASLRHETKDACVRSVNSRFPDESRGGSM
jgi:hypothetical protein